MQVMVFFIILLLVLLAFFLSWLLPNLLNALVSFLISKTIAKAVITRIPIVIFSSILLTYNVRIPGIISDWLYDLSKKELVINERVSVFHGTRIDVIHNGGDLLIKRSYLQTVQIYGNEWTMKVGFINPDVAKDNYLEWLMNQPLKIRVTENPESSHRIYVEARNDASHSYLNAKVMKDGRVLAFYTDRFRHAFPLERSKNGFIKFLLYVTQNTILNFTKDEKNRLGQTVPNKIPLTAFLNDALSIVEPPMKVSTEVMLAKVTTIENTPVFISTEEIDTQLNFGYRREKGYCDGKIDFPLRKTGIGESEDWQWGQPRGKLDGMYLQIKLPTGELTKHYIRPPLSESYYSVPQILRLECSPQLIRLLVRFSPIFGSSVPNAEYQQQAYKRMHFWILEYSWTGELLKSRQFDLEGLPPPKQFYYGPGRYIAKEFKAEKDKYWLVLTSPITPSEDEKTRNPASTKLDARYRIEVSKD